MGIKVNYFNDTDEKLLPKSKMIKICGSVFESESNKEGLVNIIVLTADNIKEINTQYLNHDWETDVISFVIDDEPFLGEIYICSEVAAKQAKEYNVSLREELLRLTAHGSLHLCGYDDATDVEREEMKVLEDKYIKLCLSE